jgi:hypothetical protein
MEHTLEIRAVSPLVTHFCAPGRLARTGDGTPRLPSRYGLWSIAQQLLYEKMNFSALPSILGKVCCK